MTKKTKVTNNETMDVLNKKFELGKAMALLRADLNEKQDKRKLHYVTFLYDLKKQYSDGLFHQRMKALEYIHTKRKGSRG